MWALSSQKVFYARTFLHQFPCWLAFNILLKPQKEEKNEFFNYIFNECYLCYPDSPGLNNASYRSNII